MPRRGTKWTAASRLLRVHAHGMQVPLAQECLELAKTEGLLRLAEFLGVAGFGIRIRQRDESLAQWRRTLVFAILREEERIAGLPHAKRWELPQNRV